MANKRHAPGGDDAGIRLLKKHVVMPDPSPELVDKIVAGAEQTVKPGILRILWPFGPVWKPAGLLVTAMAFGIYAGIAVMPVDTGDISHEIESIILG